MKNRRWVVLEPPSAGPKERTSEARFIKDAFAPMAFLVPFLWLFWHRAWLAGIVVLIAQIALSAIGELEGLGAVSMVALFGLSLLVGLEGRQIVIAHRQRKGWHIAAVLRARSQVEAELRYYHGEAASAFDTSPVFDRVPGSKPFPWQSRPLRPSGT